MTKLTNSNASLESVPIATEANFNDVRFTAEDGETILAYYEEGELPPTGRAQITANKEEAVFWVKIPQLPADGLFIYVYYGNPDAKSLSSGKTVFDFFDDFRRKGLDPAKWEIKQGTAAVSEGQLKLDSGEILSKTYQIKDGIIEYQARAGQGGEVRAILRIDKTSREASKQVAYSSVYSGAEQAIVIGDIVKANEAKAIIGGQTYDYRAILKGGDITFERYAIGNMQYARQEASVTYDNTGGITAGNIGLKAGYGDTDYFDWIRVRKFAKTKPYVSGAGDEEEVSLAEFSNTALAKNGNVVPRNTHDAIRNTQYITAPLSTACNISAITPTVKFSTDAIRNTHNAIRIDISANGGLNWGKGWLSGRSYSAPFDFTAGRELLLRANFSDTQYAIRDTHDEIEQIKLGYSDAPIVSSANISSSGASGAGGVYKLGDTALIKWDNSASGDNNSDIVSVSCNLKSFGGKAQVKMDDSNNDNIYSCQYKLPEGLNTTANIFVSATNSCGFTTRDGHILSVNTKSQVISHTLTGTSKSQVTSQEAEAKEAKAKEKAKNLMKRYKIKFGKDEAEIGDFKTPGFEPYVKLKRWGDETYFSLSLPAKYISSQGESVGVKASSIVSEGQRVKVSKIDYNSDKAGAKFYKKPREEITKEVTRSEERRVGKECRSRWSPYH